MSSAAASGLCDAWCVDEGSGPGKVESSNRAVRELSNRSVSFDEGDQMA